MGYTTPELNKRETMHSSTVSHWCWNPDPGSMWNSVCASLTCHKIVFDVFGPSDRVILRYAAINDSSFRIAKQHNPQTLSLGNRLSPALL